MSETPPETSPPIQPGERYLVKAHTGAVYGPEPMLTLVAWAQGQRVTADMLVARENTEDWRRAESYPELSRVFHTPDAKALEQLSPRGVPPLVGPAVPGGYGGAANGRGNVQPYWHPYWGPHGRPERTNSAAIASLVLGIVGMCICPFFGPMLAIALGCKAQSQIRRSQGREGGEGLALAGMVLGVIGIPCGCGWWSMFLTSHF